MLLGRKNHLSSKQKDAFQSTGTMHFFAISGLHIGVIALTFSYALRLLRLPTWLSPWIGLSLLFLYVKITGSTPSAVRAFLMTGFYWMAFSCRRQNSPFAALIGSAVFVLCVLPEQLWSLGFQLSYSVVASILLLGLPMNQRLLDTFRPFRWLPENSWKWWHKCIDPCISKLCLLFSISLSAWLASAPLSAAYFGNITPGGIILNMFLVHPLRWSSLAEYSPSAYLSNWICLRPSSTMRHGSIYHSWRYCRPIPKNPGAFFECREFPVVWAYAATIAYLAILLYLPPLCGKLKKNSKRTEA